MGPGRRKGGRDATRRSLCFNPPLNQADSGPAVFN